MKTIIDIFYNGYKHCPEDDCIVVYDEGNLEIGYENFFSVLIRESIALKKEHNLTTGDTMAILADNSVDYLIAVYSAIFARIKVLLISTNASSEVIEMLVNATGSKYLFVSEAFRNKVDLDLPGVGAIKAGKCKLENMKSCEIPRNDRIIDRAACEEFYATHAAHEDSTALIFHTSGTTNIPKIVPLSHRTVLQNQYYAHAALRNYWSKTDVTFSFLPLYHAYGMFGNFLGTMYLGACFVLYPAKKPLDAPNIIEAIAKTGATLICCVPWMLELIRQLLMRETAQGSSAAAAVLQRLNLLIVGGSKVTAELTNLYYNYDIRVVNAFGLTEAGGFVCFSDPAKKDCLHLTPTADPRIKFITTNEPESELVLIDVQNDSQQQNPYLRSGDCVEAVYTGDIFRPSQDQWLYIGRNDVIYSGLHGEKVNPLLFEEELEKCQHVSKVVVFGDNSPYNKALVELSPDVPDRNRAGAYIASVINRDINPKLDRPCRVYANDVYILQGGLQMPLTPKRTVNRKAARDLFAKNPDDFEPLQRILRAGDSQITRAVLATVRSYLNIQSAGSLSLKSSLIELGFDSIMSMSLINTIQDELNIKIPLDLALAVPALEELIAAVQQLCAASSNATDPLSASNDNQSRAAELLPRPILFEQCIFHAASCIFPFPTFTGSVSLLAPGVLSVDVVTNAVSDLESRHDILRSAYEADGTFRISAQGFAADALLSVSAINGSHQIPDNPEALKLIKKYRDTPFNLRRGPPYGFAVVDITDAQNVTRTLVYLGISHTAADYYGFVRLTIELMSMLGRDGARSVQGEKPRAAVSDMYLRAIPQVAVADMVRFRRRWARLLTVPVPDLPKSADPRKAVKRYFNLKGINLTKINSSFRSHNISLFNALYAVYVLALSKSLPDQHLDKLHTMTAVSTRNTPGLQYLMGCFVHTPILILNLTDEDSVLDIMRKVQRATTATFKKIIADPNGYMDGIFSDRSNLVPFLKRNIFLYRSPEEMVEPLAGWNAYRNDFLLDTCEMGIYFDCNQNAATNSIEGHILINSTYAGETAIDEILQAIEDLLREIAADGSLLFLPKALHRGSSTRVN